MSIKSRLFILVLVAALIAYGEYYRLSFQSEKVKYEHVNRDYQTLNTRFEDYKKDSQKVNQLDKETQEELAHVKRENDDLRNQLRSGDVGVYINTAPVADMRSTAPACVANYTRARLDDANQQDFLDLKERAEKAIIKIDGLQKYINEVCPTKQKQ